MEVLRLAGRQALLLWVAWGRGCREGATFPGRLPPVLGASRLIGLCSPRLWVQLWVMLIFSWRPCCGFCSFATVTRLKIF